MQYELIEDLSGYQSMPDDGILTRTLHDDGALKVVLFSFSAGQELSEHTASKPAVLHFLDGEAELQLGESHSTVRGGAWVHMPAGLAHGIRTMSPTTMLLYLIKFANDGTTKEPRA